MKRIFKSFKNAFNGLAILWKEEPNARIHASAMVVVVTAGVMLEIQAWEWCLISLLIGLVISAEIFNSAIERIMDHISPERHPRVKAIKDLSAGAVLILAITAIVIGLIIFLPKVLHWE
jgi:diacylglycerol kinase